MNLENVTKKISKFVQGDRIVSLYHSFAQYVMRQKSYFKLFKDTDLIKLFLYLYNLNFYRGKQYFNTITSQWAQFPAGTITSTTIKRSAFSEAMPPKS